MHIFYSIFPISLYFLSVEGLILMLNFWFSHHYFFVPVNRPDFPLKIICFQSLFPFYFFSNHFIIKKNNHSIIYIYFYIFQELYLFYRLTIFNVFSENGLFSIKIYLEIYLGNLNCIFWLCRFDEISNKNFTLFFNSTYNLLIFLIQEFLYIIKYTILSQKIYFLYFGYDNLWI